MPALPRRNLWNGGGIMKGYVQAYRNLNKKLSKQVGKGIDPKAVGDATRV